MKKYIVEAQSDEDDEWSIVGEFNVKKDANDRFEEIDSGIHGTNLNVRIVKIIKLNVKGNRVF